MGPSANIFVKGHWRAKVLDSKLHCAWTMPKTKYLYNHLAWGQLFMVACCERDCRALSKNGPPNLLHSHHIVPLELTINWVVVIIFRYSSLQ